MTCVALLLSSQCATAACRSLASKGFPNGYWKSVCVRPHSENSEPTMLISQMTPDEHFPTPPPCRWTALITLPPSPSFSSFGAASVMLCCSVPPAYSSTPLRPSVHYPSISLVVNRMYINSCILWPCKCTLYFRPDLYRFDVRLELYGANAAPRS